MVDESSKQTAVETAAVEPTITPGRPTEELQIETPDNEANVVWPSGYKHWLHMTSILVTQILVGLDLTIVAVCVPSLTDQFKTVNDIGWYVAAYMFFQLLVSLVHIPLIPLTSVTSFGKVYTLFSVKRLYITSLIIFEAGSLLCTVAPTSAAFVCGRAIAGVGNSGIVGGVILTITYSFPNRKRPLIMGLMGGVYTLAMVSAPLLGGALIDAWNWRLCFGINLPLGVIAIAFTVYGFSSPITNPELELPFKTRIRRIDPWGTLLMMPAISCLLLALQWGGTRYPWNHVSVIVLFLSSALFFAAFGYLQHRLQDKAVLPPRFLKNKTILAATWFNVCVNGSLIIVEQYLSIYFQSVKGYTPGKSGVLGIPLVIGLAIGGPVGGAVISWIGYYSIPMFATTIIAPVATGLLTTIEVDESNAKVLIYLGLLGVSMGLGSSSPLSAIQTILKPAEVSMGVAVINFGATVGAAISICASAALFQHRLINEVRQQDPNIDTAWLTGVGLSDIRNLLDADQLRRVLKGYDEAIVQTLYMPVALTTLTLIGTIGIGWRSVKEKQS